MSRRDQIKMSDDEIAAFVEAQRVVVVATNGPDGWPHLMPLPSGWGSPGPWRWWSAAGWCGGAPPMGDEGLEPPTPCV